jgi:hypothetical protein
MNPAICPNGMNPQGGILLQPKDRSGIRSLPGLPHGGQQSLVAARTKRQQLSP